MKKFVFVLGVLSLLSIQSEWTYSETKPEVTESLPDLPEEIRLDIIENSPSIRDFLRYREIDSRTKFWVEQTPYFRPVITIKNILENLNGIGDCFKSFKNEKDCKLKAKYLDELIQILFLLNNINTPEQKRLSTLIRSDVDYLIQTLLKGLDSKVKVSTGTEEEIERKYSKIFSFRIKALSTIGLYPFLTDEMFEKLVSQTTKLGDYHFKKGLAALLYNHHLSENQLKTVLDLAFFRLEKGTSSSFDFSLAMSLHPNMTPKVFKRVLIFGKKMKQNEMFLTLLKGVRKYAQEGDVRLAYSIYAADKTERVSDLVQSAILPTKLSAQILNESKEGFKGSNKVTVKYFGDLLEALAVNPSVDPSQLAEIFDIAGSVLALGLNSKMPDLEVARLRNGYASRLVEMIAGNRRTPIEVLKKLFDIAKPDADPSLSKEWYQVTLFDCLCKIAGNSAITKDMRNSLYEYALDGDLEDEEKRKLLVALATNP